MSLAIERVEIFLTPFAFRRRASAVLKGQKRTLRCHASGVSSVNAATMPRLHPAAIGDRLELTGLPDRQPDPRRQPDPEAARPLPPCLAPGETFRVEFFEQLCYATRLFRIEAVIRCIKCAIPASAVWPIQFS